MINRGVDKMKRMNLIVVFNQDKTKLLMCERTKEPQKGQLNLVGGKIEKDDDNLNEAYRELQEETGITKDDIDLVYFMTCNYHTLNKGLEIYYGVLNKNVELVEEVNKLVWVSEDDNFFDFTKYAGEGNLGHIIAEIKLELSK